MGMQTVEAESVEAQIDAIARDKTISKIERLQRILTLAVEVDRLSDGILQLLQRKLVGSYGSESFGEEVVTFYEKLRERFPEDGRILRQLADLYLLKMRDEEALRLFNRAFLIDPFLHWGQPGELNEIFAGAACEDKIVFIVTQLQCTLTDSESHLDTTDMEELVEEYRTLLSECGEDHPVLLNLLAQERIQRDLKPVLEEYAKKS
jgi:tetratricopeptide (TPR) repeat protein